MIFFLLLNQQNHLSYSCVFWPKNLIIKMTIVLWQQFHLFLSKIFIFFYKLWWQYTYHKTNFHEGIHEITQLFFLLKSIKTLIYMLKLTCYIPSVIPKIAAKIIIYWSIIYQDFTKKELKNVFEFTIVQQVINL